MTVKVKLKPEIEKQGGLLIDPISGVKIARQNYGEDGCQEVTMTAFVRKRIKSGDLIECRGDDGDGDRPTQMRGTKAERSRGTIREKRRAAQKSNAANRLLAAAAGRLASGAVPTLEQ